MELCQTFKAPQKRSCTAQGQLASNAPHDAVGVDARQHKNCDGKGHERVYAEANKYGAHIQTQAPQQRGDVTRLEDGLRDERGNADWGAVDHQVDLRAGKIGQVILKDAYLNRSPLCRARR